MTPNTLDTIGKSYAQTIFKRTLATRSKMLWILVLLMTCSTSLVYGLSAGFRVQCTQNLNVRSSASTSGGLVTTESSGSRGAISSGPQSGSGYTWWYINWDDGYSGWSAQDYLVSVPSATSNSATNVTSSSARLNGSINPNGVSTSAYFEYGLSTSYGGNTSPGSFGSGTSNVPIQSDITGLNSNTTFHYRTVAVNSGGYITRGGDVSFTTGPAAPTAPSDLAAAENSTLVSLAWNDNSNNETGFKIERKVGAGGSYTQIATTGQNWAAYSDYSISTGVTYYYRVRAYNGGGDSSYSNEVAITPLPAPYISSISPNPVPGTSSPQTINIYGSNFINKPTVTLTWTGQPNYTVSSAGVTFVSSTQLQMTITVSTTPDYWTVKVTNPNPDGQQSNTYSFQVVNAPSAPTSLQAAGNANTVLLGWARNSTNEDGFWIERKTGTEGSWSLLNNTAAGVTQYTDNAVSYGTVYYYQVRAFNSAGPSSYTNAAGATVLATPVLSSPSDGGTISGNSVSMQWNAVTGAGGYAVDIGTSLGATDVLSGAVTVTNSYDATSVAAGTYYWRVRAFSSPPESGLSAYSSSRSVVISGPQPVIRIEPTQLTIGSGAQQAQSVGALMAVPSSQQKSTADSATSSQSVVTTIEEQKKDTREVRLRARPPTIKPKKTIVGHQFHANIITVKFRDGLNIRVREGKLVDFGTGHLSSAEAVLASLSNGQWERVDSLPETRVEELRQTAQRNLRKEIADLNLQFYYSLPKGTKPATVIDTLNSLDAVELAQAIPKAVVPTPPDFQYDEGYLNAAPNGINALNAAAAYGVKGAGIKFADVEFNFNSNHQDLPLVTIIGLTPTDQTNINHGTAVLGVIAAKDDGKGVRGIAPESALYFSSIGDGVSPDNIPAALSTALNDLSAGDVMLIELQIPGPNWDHSTQYGDVPAEWYKPTYDRIVTATGLGVTVVEAAGNGYQNLDDSIYSASGQNGGHYPFLSANDSGAILVHRPSNWCAYAFDRTW